jgi:hypothetical protein
MSSLINEEFDKNLKEEQNIIELTCAICLMDIEKLTSALIDCNGKHEYHIDCIKQWAKKGSISKGNNNPGCPLCKGDFNLIKYSGKTININARHEKLMQDVGLYDEDDDEDDFDADYEEYEEDEDTNSLGSCVVCTSPCINITGIDYNSLTNDIKTCRCGEVVHSTCIGRTNTDNSSWTCAFCRRTTSNHINYTDINRSNNRTINSRTLSSEIIANNNFRSLFLPLERRPRGRNGHRSLTHISSYYG